MTSFWRNNDVIFASSVRWVVPVPLIHVNIANDGWRIQINIIPEIHNYVINI